MKKLLIAALVSTLSFQALAQTDDDDRPVPQGVQPHMIKHGQNGVDQYVGVQMNQLIKQVFNFSNSTTSVNNNPYLFIYSINLRNSGWGLRVGLGYNYNSTTNDDGITKTTSNINDMQFRLGIEKAFKLSDKWSAGVGIDGLYNTNDDKTTSAQNTALDTSASSVHTTIGSIGYGAQGWLRYNITKNILVGTESSFYYTTGKQQQSTTTTSSSFGNINTTISKASNNLSSGVFSMPVVFYLMVKF